MYTQEELAALCKCSAYGSTLSGCNTTCRFYNDVCPYEGDFNLPKTLAQQCLDSQGRADKAERKANLMKDATKLLFDVADATAENQGGMATWAWIVKVKEGTKRIPRRQHIDRCLFHVIKSQDRGKCNVISYVKDRI